MGNLLITSQPHQISYGFVSHNSNFQRPQRELLEFLCMFFQVRGGESLSHSLGAHEKAASHPYANLIKSSHTFGFHNSNFQRIQRELFSFLCMFFSFACRIVVTHSTGSWKSYSQPLRKPYQTSNNSNFGRAQRRLLRSSRVLFLFMAEETCPTISRLMENQLTASLKTLSNVDVRKAYSEKLSALAVVIFGSPQRVLIAFP